MRIAIDAREIVGQPTGVGRYLSEQLAGWAELPEASAHEFILCGPPGVVAPARAPVRTTVATSPGAGTRWEQIALRRLLTETRADVLFAPAYSGPLWCPVPMVLAMHDVSFAAHPEWFAWREGARRRLLARVCASQAARVLTLSEFSRREIIQWLGTPPDRIDVIPLGVSERVRTAPRTTGPRRPHVLYVGSLFNRRHLPALIDGFTRFASHEPSSRLDIVGDNRTRPFVDVPALAAASAASDRIRLHEYISDDDLARPYAEAGVFVFLSEYEGFGLTPLEALAAGVPIVVLDTEVAREVYGAAALYVARPDPALIADAVAQAVAAGPEREAIAAATPAVLARYSWPACARATLEALLEAGRRGA